MEEVEFDGSWSAEGFRQMMLALDDPEVFVEKERSEFEADSERKDESEEFIHMHVAGEDTEVFFGTLLNNVIGPRNLQMADALIRRVVVAQTSYPSRIRIRQIHPKILQEILEWKIRGNEAFGKKEYESAIQMYEKALLLFPTNLYVAPKPIIQHFVTLLSNTAECQLRLQRYADAGQSATHALIVDQSHEKSRMRRVKAQLAMATGPHLIQAKNDLQEILDNASTTDGTKMAKKYLSEVNDILKMEEKTFQAKNPGEDWDAYERLVRSKCW